jgi:hypothetical protein
MLAAALGGTMMLTGCANRITDFADQGGIFTEHNGRYIIRNDSGGRIMDVWKLEDTFAKEGKTGAGFVFRIPEQSEVIHVGGDAKIIRMNDDKDPRWDQYHEYHAEFNTKTYQELDAQQPKE